MSNQIVISSGAKVRNLSGVLTGTAGVVNSLGINVPSGIPQLDGSGKILVSQLPNSVMEFKGTWNAATNTPTLVNGTGNAGDVYLCNVAGTVNFGAGPITFAIGDQVLYSGTTWERASGATGTVTSVAVTESGDALSITGSPITTSGTINIGFAGTSGQYVNGAGGLTTFPSLTGYVPYTGATTNVNLGEFGLTSGYLGLDITPTSTPTAQGTMYWNADKESVDVIMNGVTGSVMQDTFFNVKNQTGASIPKGTVVRANGTLGASGRILIAPFLADGTYDSKVCLGVTAETIADGEDGKVTAFGAIRQIDTSAFPNGTILYASPSVAGAFTSTEPTNPNNIVTVAIVIYSDNSNGEIFVRPTFVDNAADITAALGYTPADDSLVVKLAGTQTITGNKTFSGVLSTTASSFIGAVMHISQSATYFPSSGYTSLVGVTDGLKLGFGSSYTSSLLFPTSTQTYTFPASSGTVALTSNLSAYLPLTGGSLTGNLNGTSIILSSQINASYAYLTNGIVLPHSGSRITGASITSLSVYSTNGIAVGFPSGQLSALQFDTTASYQYTFPSATGTVALTSNLSAYLPLTGGTLSGQLSILRGSGTGLDVASDLVIFRASTGFGSPRQITLAAGNGPTTYLEAKGYGGNYITDFGIRTYNASGVGFEVFFATSAGDVGIGNTAPAAKLDVNGSFKATGAATFSSSVTAGGFVSTQNDAILSSYGSVSRHSVVGLTLRAVTSSVFDLSLYNVAGDVLMSNPTGTKNINFNSGNVGIGTSSPSGAAGLAFVLNSGASQGRICIKTSATGDASGDGLQIGMSGNDAFIEQRENADLTFATNAAERMRITSGGFLLVGTTTNSGFGGVHRISNQTAQGNYVLSIDGGAGQDFSTLFLSVSGGNISGTLAAQWVGRNTSTLRSINAGGTINASGADYAEYMTKAIEDTIEKGDIVGVDENGLLTNIFANAKSFVVKSTDPSYVGGDTWGVKLEGEELEAAREKVDRIAFSGQVPCNVYNAQVGDYIIPIELNGKISGQAVSNPTFEQYQLSVGKVWKIMEDGRAWIAVKIG